MVVAMAVLDGEVEELPVASLDRETRPDTLPLPLPDPLEDASAEGDSEALGLVEGAMEAVKGFVAGMKEREGEELSVVSPEEGDGESKGEGEGDEVLSPKSFPPTLGSEDMEGEGEREGEEEPEYVGELDATSDELIPEDKEGEVDVLAEEDTPGGAEVVTVSEGEGERDTEGEPVRLGAAEADTEALVVAVVVWVVEVQRVGEKDCWLDSVEDTVPTSLPVAAPEEAVGLTLWVQLSSPAGVVEEGEPVVLTVPVSSPLVAWEDSLGEDEWEDTHEGEEVKTSRVATGLVLCVTEMVEDREGLGDPEEDSVATPDVT